MTKITLVILAAVLLSGCGSSSHGHLGGVLAPLLYGTVMDPEEFVRRPASCVHVGSRRVYTRPVTVYGRYRTFTEYEVVEEGDNYKECGSTYTIR